MLRLRIRLHFESHSELVRHRTILLIYRRNPFLNLTTLSTIDPDLDQDELRYLRTNMRKGAGYMSEKIEGHVYLDDVYNLVPRLRFIHPLHTFLITHLPCYQLSSPYLSLL
jgi:hypothetical protein